VGVFVAVGVKVGVVVIVVVGLGVSVGGKGVDVLGMVVAVGVVGEENPMLLQALRNVLQIRTNENITPLRSFIF